MQKPPFELRTLGPTELHGPDSAGTDALVRQPKRLALLAYLAVATADGFRRRDQVIGFFWPELDQSQARTYLRKAVYGIRESLGQEVFLTRGEDEIRVDPALVWCDAVALSEHVREGRWSEALTLYRGELLEGLFPEGVAPEFQEWLSAQRKQLRERAAQAAWECSRLEEERGDRTAAAVMGRRARELDPDNEEGVRRLMGLLDRRGDRGSALRVYAEWQSRLLEEFGVEPAPETRKLARQVQAARKGESHETPPVQTPIGPGPNVGSMETSSPGERPVANRAAVSQPATRKKRVGVVAVAAILVIAVLLAATVLRLPTVVDPNSVTLLPLRLIGDPALRSTADAITEEMTMALVQDSTISVRILTRSDAGSVGSTDASLGSGAITAFVLDGGVQGGAGRVRVTLRLVRSADAVAVWAGSADLEAADLVVGAQRLASEARQAMRRVSSR
jgi:DNA-binding SARP family transcriptional activator/TolB-like protein